MVLKMILKLSIIFTFTLVAFCNSAFVDSLSKCDIDDTICQKDLIQRVLKDISKTGIEDYNIPAVDPMDIKNIKISLIGLLNITVKEGEARGVKDCVINKIVTEYKENGRLVLDLTCDLNVKAKIKLEDISPFIQNILGQNSLEGGGNAKVKLNKLNIIIELFYDIIRKDDGEIYFKCKPDLVRYKYEIGDAKIIADKILLGNQDASEAINLFMEQNWKFAMTTFGKNFFDVALGIVIDLLHAFFDKTPAKFIITTDLSPYVKN